MFHRSEKPVILIYSIKHATLVFTLLLLFFVLVPLLFRNLERRYGFRMIVFSLVPIASLLVFIYLTSHYIYYSTRRYLFDPYLQIPKPQLDTNGIEENAVRVLCLGGSTTEGFMLPKGRAYPEILEESLKSAYPGRPIHVFNAGRSWYTSRHSLINYVTSYRRLKPHVVIVMHAINDVYRSFSTDGMAMGEFREDYSHFYGPSIRGADPPTYESHLVGRYGRYLGMTWFSLFLNDEMPVDHGIDRYVSIRSFEYNMRTLVNAVRNDGSVCILLEEPYYYHDGYADWEYRRYNAFSMHTKERGRYASVPSRRLAMDSFNGVARRIAREEDVLYIETRGYTPSDTSLFFDDVHHTIRGARALAEGVALTLVKSESLTAVKK